MFKYTSLKYVFCVHILLGSEFKHCVHIGTHILAHSNALRWNVLKFVVLNIIQSETWQIVIERSGIKPIDFYTYMLLVYFGIKNNHIFY